VQVVLVNPLTDARWDAFATAHPDGTIFHHSAWAKVLNESYALTLRYYALEDGEDFKAIAPFCHVRSPLTGNRLVCLPFSDYCFPLASGPEEMKLLLEPILKQVAMPHLPLEIRHWGTVSRPQDFSLIENPYFVAHTTDLNNSNKNLMSRINNRARRGVRTAEKQQVSIRLTTEYDDVKQFYRLNVKTRRKLGVLPQPLRFFQAIHRYLFASGLGYLLVAEVEGKVVAGVLYLLFRDTCTYKFNASSPFHLYLRPNHLLIFKGMELAIQKGYKHFNFGRSEIENKGLREFKSQWASVESALPYYYFPALTGVGALSTGSLKRKAMSLFTRCVPEPVLKMAGSVLYHHMA